MSKIKFLVENGYDLENMHLRPHVGKAQMRLRTV